MGKGKLTRQSDEFEVTAFVGRILYVSIKTLLYNLRSWNCIIPFATIRFDEQVGNVYC